MTPSAARDDTTLLPRGGAMSDTTPSTRSQSSVWWTPDAAEQPHVPYGTPAPMGDAEADCRAFAAQYGHLPNVAEGMRLAEAGRISWLALAGVFANALAKGLAAVR